MARGRFSCAAVLLIHGLRIPDGHDIIQSLYDSRAIARKLTPRGIQKRGVMRMTTVELFTALIAVASLALTIYFGMKR